MSAQIKRLTTAAGGLLGAGGTGVAVYTGAIGTGWLGAALAVGTSLTSFMGGYALAEHQENQLEEKRQKLRRYESELNE